jgi:hypothetical protein
LGVCVGGALAVVAAGVGGVGCHAGTGTLTGEGGAGTLSGAGGRRAGGGGSVILGFAGAGAATGTAGAPYMGCGAALMPVNRVPAKIVIVLDISASMNDAADGSCTGGCGSASKWSAVVGGIDAVVGTNDVRVEWGLELIGRSGDSCDAGGIDVAVASSTGSTIITNLARRTAAGQLAVAGNRPTRAAVGVATAHLQGLSFVGSSALLLLTDGQPDCGAGAADPRAVDTAATLDAITHARNDGIPTFVLGVGLLDPATADALSRMAIEGAFPRAESPQYVPVFDASAVAHAINDVVITLSSCAFAIPPPPTTDGTTSRGDILVFADGVPVPLDPNNGWTYVDSTQTAITLHGSSCNAILNGTAQQVMIAFPCYLI